MPGAKALGRDSVRPQAEVAIKHDFERFTMTRRSKDEFDWERDIFAPNPQCNPIPYPHGRILNADEAAELLKIHKSTLYKWVKSGRFRRGVKPGKPLLFDEDVIRAELFRHGF